MKKQFLFFSILPLCLNSCIFLLLGAGTLGGFDRRVFPVSEEKLSRTVSLLYEEYPEYRIPKKWESLNDWEERGYGFLDTRIFYFKTTPEEMYYVSFIGDSAMRADPSEAILSIRAVNNGKTGWRLEKEFKKEERERIEQRFNNEIINKLEEYTFSKSIRTK